MHELVFVLLEKVVSGSRAWRESRDTSKPESGERKQKKLASSEHLLNKMTERRKGGRNEFHAKSRKKMKG